MKLPRILGHFKLKILTELTRSGITRSCIKAAPGCQKSPPSYQFNSLNFDSKKIAVRSVEDHLNRLSLSLICESASWPEQQRCCMCKVSALVGNYKGNCSYLKFVALKCKQKHMANMCDLDGRVSSMCCCLQNRLQRQLQLPW